MNSDQNPAHIAEFLKGQDASENNQSAFPLLEAKVPGLRKELADVDNQLRFPSYGWKSFSAPWTAEVALSRVLNPDPLTARPMRGGG